MIQTFAPYDVKRWVEENKHLYNPPYKTNRVVVDQKEFIVIIVHGPNTRLDFHIEPADEFFYQVHGNIELHLKPEDGRREVLKIREGEMFLCPGDLAHSPRRPGNTWGLVIERKRRSDEKEMFVWFCEMCDAQVLSRTVVQGDIATQVIRGLQRRSNHAHLQGLWLHLSTHAYGGAAGFSGEVSLTRGVHEDKCKWPCR